MITLFQLICAIIVPVTCCMYYIILFLPESRLLRSELHPHCRTYTAGPAVGYIVGEIPCRGDIAYFMGIAHAVSGNPVVTVAVTVCPYAMLNSISSRCRDPFRFIREIPDDLVLGEKERIIFFRSFSKAVSQQQAVSLCFSKRFIQEFRVQPLSQ